MWTNKMMSRKEFTWVIVLSYLLKTKSTKVKRRALFQQNLKYVIQLSSHTKTTEERGRGFYQILPVYTSMPGEFWR